MGEVYRARDTKLKREVALKVLPDSFASDPERMARFQREAEVLASLNHPNIAQIYGVEERALVMELVEGEHLRGPLPVETALTYGKQIADALEAAHEKGIIHRDLKPANIKITPDGVVKVLDFGLAAVAQGSPTGVADPSISPTLTIRATQAGMIMGSAAYMSPEQAAGKPVDKRSDIWSFGVVLWEMFTGQRLFDGETISHTLADVLRAEIDFGKLPKDTPTSVRNLLQRCLDRDVKKRLRDIGEARVALDKAALDKDDAAQEAPAAPPARPLAWMIVAAAAIILAAALAVGLYRATRPASLRALMRLSIDLGPDAAMASGAPSDTLTFSPDGSRLVFVSSDSDGKRHLSIRLLDQNQVTLLPGTENAGFPFFSPDSQWIGFYTYGQLKKIAVQGGPPLTLCDCSAGPGASWGDDGNIVASLTPAGGLSRIPSSGGVPEPLTQLDKAKGEATHRWPQVLPGAKAVLFTAHTSRGSYDDANIDVISLSSGQRKTVYRGGFFGRYLPSGHLIYMRRNTLFAAPFDLQRLALTGTPVPLLEDVRSAATVGGYFGFSQSGSFAYLSGTQSGASIFWLDGLGKLLPLHPAPGSYVTPTFSPDGKRLAFSMLGRQGSDIWVQDLDRDSASRLTFLSGLNSSAVWSPDGRFIVFRSSNPAVPGLYWTRADGSGEPQRLTDGKHSETPFSFSPDGKRLAITQQGDGTGSDIWTVPIEGDRDHPRLGKPDVFLQTPSEETYPEFSPDGHWLAYYSNESGDSEVYVRPFPGPGGKWQISTGGGYSPRWSSNARELFFQRALRAIMVAGYSVQGDSFVPGKPRVWSESGVPAGNSLSALAPDGKRFAVVLPSEIGNEQKPITQVTFLLNFFDELRRRVPAGK
jgi:serine/threonine-protein kinase